MHPFAQARKHKRTHASYAIIACHAAGPLQKETALTELMVLQYIFTTKNQGNVNSLSNNKDKGQ